jgi:cob(I)alamin adenosyltransferase
MPIYTKKGDKGETGLFAGERVSKDSLRIEAIGAIDELNSLLGIVVAETEDLNLKDRLEGIQESLLTIGSILGGSELKFYKTRTNQLEGEIDRMEEKLPPLKNFIIPGGSKVAARLQFARSLSRRAERRVVALGTIEVVKPQILAFLNRLSDYFFVLSRMTNNKLGFEDKVWKKK